MNFKWEKLPPLPPAEGQTNQPGVASPFVGVHHDALIVAGGANFPDKAPWEGGTKVWWRDLFVLENATGTHPHWVTGQHFALSRPLAYGFSVSTSAGVVCVGGADAERCYADAFLLAWDPAARTIRQTPLPPMPEPLAFMAGALIGDTLYVAGGQHVMKGAVPSSAFYALDLSKRDAAKWSVLPTWPGPPRIVPVAAAQHAPSGDEFFLFSGRVPQAGRATEILTDAYAFDPKTKTWRTLPKIGGGAGTSVMAGTAAAWGREEVLVFGGDRGDLFRESEEHDLAVETLKKQPGDHAAEIAAHLEAKKKIYASHPGFGREVFAFNTRTNHWHEVARASLPLPVTTIAVKTGDAILIPSGEVRPGVRTTTVIRALPALVR